MALTLTEAAKLSNDVLVAGVVETIIKDSPVTVAFTVCRPGTMSCDPFLPDHNRAHGWPVHFVAGLFAAAAFACRIAEGQRRIT